MKRYAARILQAAIADTIKALAKIPAIHMLHSYASNFKRTFKLFLYVEALKRGL
jgi:hypothetical protein